MNRGRIGVSASSIGAILVANKKRMAGKGGIRMGQENREGKGAGEGGRRNEVERKKATFQ